MTLKQNMLPLKFPYADEDAQGYMKGDNSFLRFKIKLLRKMLSLLLGKERMPVSVIF